MKMRRKGFLAAMLGLAAAPVLGKMKEPKPKFPRYFQRPRAECSSCFLFVVHGLCDVEGFWPNGQSARPMHIATGSGCPMGPNQEATLAWLQAQKAEGHLKEITAAEAEALLGERTRNPNVCVCGGRDYHASLDANGLLVWEFFCTRCGRRWLLPDT